MKISIETSFKDSIWINSDFTGQVFIRWKTKDDPDAIFKSLETLNQKGIETVAHLPLKALKDQNQLRQYLKKILSTNTKKILVINGDHNQPYKVFENQHTEIVHQAQNMGLTCFRSFDPAATTEESREFFEKNAVDTWIPQWRSNSAIQEHHFNEVKNNMEKTLSIFPPMALKQAKKIMNLNSNTPFKHSIEYQHDIGDLKLLSNFKDKVDRMHLFSVNENPNIDIKWLKEHL